MTGDDKSTTDGKVNAIVNDPNAVKISADETLPGPSHDQVIQWFPGHMKQTLNRIDEKLKMIDAIIEVRDARVPLMSANPQLERFGDRRPRVVVLTRVDLADPTFTKNWITYFRANGLRAVAVDAKQHGDLQRVTHEVEILLPLDKQGRILIVGIPNSGKSTIINGLVGRNVARAENRAGVTRALQWFKVSPRLALLDSPGILVPKIATARAQWILALTGAIPRERYDAEEVIARFARACREDQGRGGIPSALVPDLPEFAAKRGFRRKGDVLDLENAARAYLKYFNDGGFGRFTFEAPPLE